MMQDITKELKRIQQEMTTIVQLMQESSEINKSLAKEIIDLNRRLAVLESQVSVTQVMDSSIESIQERCGSSLGGVGGRMLQRPPVKDADQILDDPR